LPIAAAAQAVYATMKALRDGVAPKDVPGIASPELMRRVTRETDYRRWIKEFLAGV
jgi:oxaloacetate decarboxylase